MTDRQREPKTLFFKHIVRKIFLEDWALKLTALVITLALWFGVTGLSTPTKERLTVPLNPTISTDAVIMNAIRQDVDILISGDKRKLDQINRSDLSAGLDLTAVGPGDWVIALSPDTVSVALPPGVKLVNVQPGNMAVKLEAVEEKDIEVKVLTESEPAAGFEIYSTSILPQKIRVRGPASVMQTLDDVLTDKIDLTGKKEDFTSKQIPVNVSNAKAAVLNTVVDVFFHIGEKRVERAFTLPIPGAPGNTISFVVYGPRSALARIKADAIKVGWANGNMVGYQDPEINLPSELQGVAEIRKIKSTLPKGE